MSDTLISRKLTLDAGHRVPDHKSKCRSFHGHTYHVECFFTCGALASSGPANGMVADFGDIKKLMADEIHDPCDHKMILYVKDPMILMFQGEDGDDLQPDFDPNWDLQGHDLIGLNGIKLHVVNFIPTAELLAKYWFQRIALRLESTLGFASGAGFAIKKIKVGETPNCTAEYAHSG